jgi:hypothetical protein
MSEEDGPIKPPLGNVSRRRNWLTLPTVTPRLAWVAAGGGAGGVLLIVMLGGAARGCRASGRVDELEQRLAHVETALGISDAGVITSVDPAPIETAPAGGATAATIVATVDASPECAVAKIAAYQAWQDAYARAKALAAPAQASCAGMWSDQKKQICYHAASAGPRAAQAVRDSVIAGGAAAHDAVNGVKDDAKNEALAPARAASQRAFAACGEGG